MLPPTKEDAAMYLLCRFWGHCIAPPIITFCRISSAQTLDRTAAMANNQRTNQPTQPAAERPTPSDHDDFRDYQSWVRRAVASDISFSAIRQDWDALPADQQAHFAGTLRAFWRARGLRAQVEIELRVAANEASILEYDEGNERDIRNCAREARKRAKSLNDSLRDRRVARTEILDHQNALNDALATRPDEEIRKQLQAHQQKLKDNLDADETEGEAWITNSERFLGKVIWTSETIDALKEFATAILNGLGEPNSPSIRGSSNDRSSSKRKRQDEVDEASSKSLRRSGGPPAARSRSAAPGAGRSEHHSSLNAEGASSRQVPPPELAEQLVALPEPLPFPAVGVPGPETTWLINHHAELQPSFISWCRRQLVNDAHSTLEEAEEKAAAFVVYHRCTMNDHDWENEPDVRWTPFHEDHFREDHRPGPHWPNVRRLIAMSENASDDFRDFVDRHIATNGAMFVACNAHALRVLRLVQEKGLEHDWDLENDLFMNKPPLEATLHVGLTDLARRGHWNVSVLMSSSY